MTRASSGASVHGRVERMLRYGSPVALLSAAAVLSAVAAAGAAAAHLLPGPPGAAAIAIAILGAAAGAGGLALALWSRLDRRGRDLEAAVALHGNLSREAVGVAALFTDGAAANATLALFLWKCAKRQRPRNVLEIGAGESTRLLAAYRRLEPAASVRTLEHDPAWAATLAAAIEPELVEIALRPLRRRTFACPGTRAPVSSSWYDVDRAWFDRRFDLVLVDGPDAAGERARWGVLQWIPEILADSFVVVVDDAERRDEAALADALARLLLARGIPFRRFRLTGWKLQEVFVSPDLRFLASS